MKQLDIFDFDGTLARTPCDTVENHKIYEDHHKIPWLINKTLSRELSNKSGKFVGMRSGWWGRQETLEPPLVPNPAPDHMFIKETCDALIASKSNPECITVIMTGRHAGLKRNVLRILDNAKLVKVKKTQDGYDVIDEDVTCWFLGENGPFGSKVSQKPTATFPWKSWIIEQYLLNYDISKVVIWEDRVEHVEAFLGLNESLGWEFVVNHVK